MSQDTSLLSTQSEEIAHSEIFVKVYKARTKCETHKVKPHKVRATCIESIVEEFFACDWFTFMLTYLPAVGTFPPAILNVIILNPIRMNIALWIPIVDGDWRLLFYAQFYKLWTIQVKNFYMAKSFNAFF